MKFKRGKLVRFNDGQNLDKTLPVQKTSAPLFKMEGGHINSDRSTSNKVPKFGRFKVSPENNHEPYWRERILDPGSDVIFNFNRIFLFSCLTALFVDRLFLGGELVIDPKLIARRYWRPDFFIDLVAALALPQLNVLSSDFLEKYLHGLWWGLQNLSSFGQSLSTSTFIGETAFSIRFSIFGLVLFAHLIGNMQMDDQLLDAICGRLVSLLKYSRKLYSLRRFYRDAFYYQGKTRELNSKWTVNSFLQLNYFETWTVRALEEVEAFALRSEDLKFVTNQCRRLHSKKLQHTFRFHSDLCRTWAACFIQAAWHRHRKRLIAKSLSMSEPFSVSVDEQTVDETTREGHA